MSTNERLPVAELDPPGPAAGPMPASGEAQDRLAALVEAVAVRDNFIAVAAHELRNPMTPIIGQIELLLDGFKAGRYGPNDIETRLERLHRSVEHYMKRSATLLDVSRMTSGKFRLTPAPCDLRGVVKLVADNFKETAQHAGTTITIDAPHGVLGRWDRLAVEQIVDNLVSNAIKYGGGRPVVVCLVDRGSDIALKVRDHGPGISPRDRERIFGRFERAVGLDELRTGFGVGLWVVGQIVETMQGAITVSDAPGGGTVFEVTLPRTGTEDDE